MPRYEPYKSRYKGNYTRQIKNESKEINLKKPLIIKVSKVCLGYTKSFPDKVGSIVFGSSPAFINNSFEERFFTLLFEQEIIAIMHINAIKYFLIIKSPFNINY